MEKYEEKLYGKIDFLHEKTLLEQNKMNIFTDMLKKYQTALINFAKSLEGIKTLNKEIISEKDNSLSRSLQNFKKAISVQIEEFKECPTHIERTVIDPIIQSKDVKNKEEKEMYNQYNKFKTLYNNSKSNCEKAKKDFYVNAKFCENSIHNLIQYKSNTLSSDGNSEINKLEEKMKAAILSTKTLEEKYIKSIEEANNMRNKMVTKEEELLKFYQKMNYDFYNKINCAIIYIIPILKKMFSAIILELNSTEEKCKKMDIQNDINDFIKNNSTNLQEKPLIFEPYYPQADLKVTKIPGDDKKQSENLDINYHIMEILKKNFRDIRKDINMEKEQKKFRLRFLCNQIFKIGPGVGFSSEEKQELISLIKKPKHKTFFLVTLSKQRTKGRYKRSEKLVKELVEILINILYSSEKNNDFESIKNCIILSETFYYEIEKNKKQENNKKIYLIDYIKYYKWFQNIDFWKGIIERMIQKEIESNEKINKKNKTNETPEEIKKKISNIGFSIVLSYTNTMIEFNFSKENINKIVDIFVEKYNIEEGIAQAIYENVKATSLPETNEENKKFFDEIFDKFEKNKINEENIEIKQEENNAENEQIQNEIIISEDNGKYDINKENDENNNNIEKEEEQKEEINENEIIDEGQKNEIKNDQNEEDDKLIENNEVK